MKKLVVILCVLLVLTSIFAGAALADPGTSSDKQQDKEERQAEREAEKAEREAEREAAKAEREEAKELWKAEFEANKLARQELKIATKIQIAEQREIVNEYKKQLQALMQEIEDLPEEERALYEDQINELRTLFKDAQGYVLQIRFEGLEAKSMLSPSIVTPAQQPVPEVETVEEVVEEVLGDLEEE